MQLIPLSGFPLVQPGDDIVQLLVTSLDENQLTLEDGDLLVLAQKIVSKSEGRYKRFSEIVPSEKALKIAPVCDKDPRLVELILSESTEVLRLRPGVIIVEHRHGYVHANAGIDRSNIPSLSDDEQVLLLPENPDQSASLIRNALQERYGVGLAVIINDSAGRAWRNGTIGFAIGTAGFEPLVNMVGEQDLFQRKLEVTEVAVADELAAAASFVMGQAAEGIPVVLIKGATLRTSDCGSTSLVRDRQMDLFR